MSTAQLLTLRSLYHPVQPTVKPYGHDVLYEEFLPDTLLQPYIFCYWHLRTTRVLSEPFFYRVVADGCIDIFFELDSPRESFVMGFCKRYTAFPLDNSFHYVGVRFLPAMFPQLFGVDASSLSNRVEALDAVVPHLAEYIALHATGDAQHMRTLFDRYFRQHLSRTTRDHDGRLYQALHIILKNYGVVAVDRDLDTGFSARQLRRVFAYYIGDTAKTFSKVVRFQNILRAKPSGQSLRGNKLFYDSGYYDQAHFIKEFKNFYGVTPSKAFGR